jgi:hypothetical protein
MGCLSHFEGFFIINLLYCISVRLKWTTVGRSISITIVIGLEPSVRASRLMMESTSLSLFVELSSVCWFRRFPGGLSQAFHRAISLVLLFMSGSYIAGDSPFGGQLSVLEYFEATVLLAGSRIILGPRVSSTLLGGCFRISSHIWRSIA